MSRFIQGEHRFQSALFPERLDDYIKEDNPVRVIEAFVEELDLFDLGFSSAQPKETGRPAYHPATMLKLYIYGYLNKIQSSRRLERETHRNVELMWLLNRLSPDFKTIADFRKDHGKAIKAACHQFVMICKRLDLFSDSLIAIDGSRFNAVQHRERNFTTAKLKRRINTINESLDRYFDQLESFNRQERRVPVAKKVHIEKQIKSLKRQMKEVRAIEAVIELAPDKQISLTDPNARAMATNARSSGTVG